MMMAREQNENRRDFANDVSRESSGAFVARRLRELMRDPAHWALTIATLRDVPIRIHVLLPLFAFVVLARVLVAPTANPLGGDFIFALTGVAALVLAVMIHELGHFAMTWFIVGETDEVILWPLGGLTEPVTPTQELRKKEFIVAAAGPALNVIVCVILSPILIALIGEWRDLASNILDPATAYSVWAVGGKPAWWIMALWWLNYTSAIIALFNLVPMLPLDGATMLESALRMRIGRERAAEITTAIGYLVAGMLALTSIVAGATIALAVAGFGAMCTHRRSRQLAFVAGLKAEMPGDRAGDSPHLNHTNEKTPSFDTDLDRILDKIHHEGIEALTDAERGILHQASSTRRDS